MAHEVASCLGIFSTHQFKKENCIIILLFEQTIIVDSERDTVCVSVAALFHSNTFLLLWFLLSLSNEVLPERSWGRDYLCHGNPQFLIFSKKLLSPTKLFRELFIQRERKRRWRGCQNIQHEKERSSFLLSMGSPLQVNKVCIFFFCYFDFSW